MHPVARWGKKGRGVEEKKRAERRGEEKAGWLAGGFILSLSTTYVPSTAELTGRDTMCWPEGLLETCKWINIEQWEGIGVLNDISNDAHPLQSISSVQKRLMRTQLLGDGKATALTAYSLKQTLIAAQLCPLFCLSCDSTNTLPSSSSSCIHNININSPIPHLDLHWMGELHIKPLQLCVFHLHMRKQFQKACL